MDITTKTVIELKAMIYDQMAIIEQSQQNIKALNEELIKKVESTKEEIVEKSYIRKN